MSYRPSSIGEYSVQLGFSIFLEAQVPRDDLAESIGKSIRQWRETLIDLGLRNPLLNFKGAPTSSIDLSAQSLSEILDRLASKNPSYLVGTKPEPPKVLVDEDDLAAQVIQNEEPFDYSRHPDSIFVDRTQRDVDRAVRNLSSRASRSFLDRGVNPLHIALGSLTWLDVDEQSHRAPLILLPVKLVKPGPRLPVALTKSDDDLAVNPALGIKLQEFGIQLPSDLEVGQVYLDSGVDAALNLFRELNLPEGWSVSESQVLSMFTFHKESMYRDLLENQEAVASNALVQALGSGGQSIAEDFFFDPLEDSEVDRTAPPEVSPLVLDADSSQRAAIDAALMGKSFVLDGPPGTGKSQTIANMIGALIGSGKTVLFVSEKIVALEVVKERLEQRGLASLVFELHSAKTSRKEVAQFLGRSLTTRASFPNSMKAIEVEKARERREGLNSYAEAMNTKRDPLDISVHQAMGLVESSHVSVAMPEPEGDPDSLSSAAFEQIRESAARIQKHWALLLEGSDAIWFGLENDRELAFKLETLRSALTNYEDEYGALHAAAKALRLQGTFDYSDLHALLEKWSSAPAEFRERSWIVETDVELVASTVQSLQHESDRLETLKASYSELLGSTWNDVPDSLSLPTGAEFSGAIEILGGAESLKARRTKKLAKAASAAAKKLEEIDLALNGFSNSAGVSAPETLAGLGDYLECLEILVASNCPPIEWFSNRIVLNSVIEAEKALRASTEEQTKHREQCVVLSERSLELDLATYRDFFSINRKFMDRFSKPYRQKRQELMAVSTSRNWKAVTQSLEAAAKWQSSVRQLEVAEKRHAGDLGRYYQGLETDWSELSFRIADAERIARSISVLDKAIFSAAVSENRFVSDVAGLHALAEGALGAVQNLESAAEDNLSETAQKSSLLVLSTSLSGVADLFSKVEGAYEALERKIDRDVSAITVTKAMDLLSTYRENRSSTAEKIGSYALELNTPIDSEEFFTASKETVAGFQERLTWTRELLDLAAERNENQEICPLTEGEFVALEGAQIPPSLQRASEKWSEAFENFSSAFSQEKEPFLIEMLDEFRGAKKFLKELKARLPEIDQWIDLDFHRTRLVNHGFERVIEAAVDLDIDDKDVAGFLVNSVLRKWIDHQLDSDSKFGDSPAIDRDDLIRQFRELDEKLKDHAIAQIIDAAESIRPRNFSGQASGIQREAEKKARHKAVREQIAQSDEVIKALHPCFMMSPLAVSQYLPSDIRFDVVIFDEASQVTPSDAINCIYRGDALISAGDQKQLPPTNFFQNMAGDDESEEENDATDFESILDLMKGSGAFNSLTLKWHYRSRHEHLIAFSNSSFYESKLITFPGAIDESPDLGVKLFKVPNGVYRRSAGADNPIEARVVAQRVLHHFDTRPDKSLGVVAFSSSQRDTVDAAVTLARRERPDLDHFFDVQRGDRQRGFFVENLESVQGDERDVIIFSIGYGPDEAGKVYKNFGPVSRVGGERRLNVAFTRARELVEVVSSMDASHLGKVNPGPAQHLRRYLDFAERGPVALQLDLGEEGLEPESPFEESVIAAVRSWGYDVQPQVGVAGYRIDFGVIHPQHKGTFLLGVECDGAMYHSSRTARDRDRLRHEILEGLGWTIHHIWGTSWYRHRETEMKKLRQKIEELAGQPVSGRLMSKSSPPENLIEIDFEEVRETDHSEWSQEYTVAIVERISHSVDLADPSNARKLVPLVKEVVSIEEPVHIETVMQRLRQAADIGRVGQRIRKTLDAAIALSQVEEDGEFLSINGSPPIVVRTPGLQQPRDIERIHPLELQAAILGAAKDAIGIRKQNLVDVVARIFGWQRKGAKITLGLEEQIDDLVARKVLTENNGGLRVV